MKKVPSAPAQTFTPDQLAMLQWLEMPDAAQTIDSLFSGLLIHINYFIDHPGDAEQSDFQAFHDVTTLIKMIHLASKIQA